MKQQEETNHGLYAAHVIMGDTMLADAHLSTVTATTPITIAGALSSNVIAFSSRYIKYITCAVFMVPNLYGNCYYNRGLGWRQCYMGRTIPSFRMILALKKKDGCTSSTFPRRTNVACLVRAIVQFLHVRVHPRARMASDGQRSQLTDLQM